MHIQFIILWKKNIQVLHKKFLFLRTFTFAARVKFQLVTTCMPLYCYKHNTKKSQERQEDRQFKFSV